LYPTLQDGMSTALPK